MNIENVWVNLRAQAGAEFRTITGRPFSYDCLGNALQLRNTARNIAKSQIAKALTRWPVTGPGALQDLQGPSYLFALLSDPRIARSASNTNPSSEHPLTKHPPTSQRRGEISVERYQWEDSLAEAGTRTSDAELRRRGFIPFTLRFTNPLLELPEGPGAEWDTIGAIPAAPGLYAFTIQAPRGPLRVVYVGMTTHLWMVTKGRLPSGASRPGQRYGHPRYAGATRKRINTGLAEAHRQGMVVTHWLHPVEASMTDSELRAREEALIQLWNLRRLGWNRG
jgi:hypothetical protein